MRRVDEAIRLVHIVGRGKRDHVLALIPAAHDGLVPAAARNRRRFATTGTRDRRVLERQPPARPPPPPRPPLQIPPIRPHRYRRRPVPPSSRHPPFLTAPPSPPRPRWS